MQQTVNRKKTLACLAALMLSVLLCMPGVAWGRGEPVAGDPYEDAAATDLADGEYLVDVVLEGGTGRATISSPAKLSVSGGKAAVTAAWSSPNYDYMVVAGKQYLPVNAGGNSMFLIPVVAFNEPFDVVGDTTAMSEPHEVDYTLTVDEDSIQDFDPSLLSSQEGSSGSSNAGSSSSGGAGSTAESSASAASSSTSAPQNAGLPMPWIVFIVCAILAALAVGLAIGIVRGNRNK